MLNLESTILVPLDNDELHHIDGGRLPVGPTVPIKIGIALYRWLFG